MHSPRALSLPTLLLLAAGFTTSIAQPHAAGNRIAVHGTGEIRVAPDMVLLTVEASNNASSPLSASNDTRKDMNQILAAARKIVRDSIRDVRTTRISVNPEYEWTEGKRKFRGFVASQSLEITLFDVTKAEALLEAVMRAPVHTVGNLEFRHTKTDSLHRAASVLAMRNAAENARTLCGAAKRSCEELIGVRAAGVSTPGPFPAAEFKAARMMSADAGGGMPVQPGLLVFSSSLEAEYRLEAIPEAKMEMKRDQKREAKPEPKPEEEAKGAPAPVSPAPEGEAGEAAP